MAKVAETYLRRRLTGFMHGSLGSNRSIANRIVGDAITSVLQRLEDSGARAYLVGGTLRDLCCGPSVAVPRDIDIIVENRCRAELYDLFGDLYVRDTRFGGLHLVRTVEFGERGRTIAEILFDVWSLSDTWAIQHLELEPKIEHFPQTTFLNLDSAAVSLSVACVRKRPIYSHRFFEGIQEKVIDINLAENPFPSVCTIRALVMAAKLGFRLSANLGEFVRNSAMEVGSEGLEVAQLSHYGEIRCSPEEVDSWLTDIQRALRDNPGLPIEIASSAQRQRELWAWPSGTLGISVTVPPKVQQEKRRRRRQRGVQPDLPFGPSVLSGERA